MMSKMVIFEPAMCCSTGVCGPSVDKELLRVSTVVNSLKNKGVEVERYNLASSPQEFVNNDAIKELLNKESIEVLPVTMVDGTVVKKKEYPTNEEFCKLLNVSEDYLMATSKIRKVTLKVKPKSCSCGDDCC
jgi:hypothetical protein